MGGYNAIDFPEHVFVVLRKDADNTEFYSNREEMPVQAVVKIELYDGMDLETFLTNKDDDIAIMTLKDPLKFSPEVCWKLFSFIKVSPFSCIRSVYLSMKTSLK